MSETIMNTYARLPVTFARGAGSWLWDQAGKRYLDAVSGVAVCSLGHAHPAITKTLCEQASQLIHTSNLYGIERQQQLADRLCALSGMERAFFSNSGAEANEAAIKIARLYGHKKGIKVPEIIVMENSFHGRTLATLSATGNRKVQAGFEPLVQGFVRAPYNDLEAIRTIAHNSPHVVAVLVEPVQGEGGVRIPDRDYLNGIRTLCDEHGWLMMLDEIQTGMCRSGAWFAHQHNHITPDVMTLAKALGNGMPIGACLARGEAAEIMHPGNHGSTFGGNPLACSVALSVIEVMEQEQLAQRAQQLGQAIVDGLGSQLQALPGVRQIRNLGMLIGIELEESCTELVARALEQGLLINVTAGNVIRLLPPLTMSDEEVAQLVTQLGNLVQEFLCPPAMQQA